MSLMSGWLSQLKEPNPEMETSSGGQNGAAYNMSFYPFETVYIFEAAATHMYGKDVLNGVCPDFLFNWTEVK